MRSGTFTSVFLAAAWIAGGGAGGSACDRLQLQPTAYPVPGGGVVIEGRCSRYDYVVLPVSECAYLTCSGSLVYAFCDRSRYSYCGCAEGDEALPPQYHRVRLDTPAGEAPRKGSAPDAAPPDGG